MSGPLATTAAPVLPTLAIGWPLLPVPDPDGRLLWPAPAASVRQMIEVIIRTAPGEQLMRPTFGAGLERFVHETNTLSNRARAQELVTAALRRYEPRILLDTVDVDEGEDPREMLVTIAYRLALTGEPAVIQARVGVGGG